MSIGELVTQGFGALNSFKRHRALKEIKQYDQQYHDLQMYKMIDKLELALRAIQKEVRLAASCTAVMEDEEDESND